MADHTSPGAALPPVKTPQAPLSSRIASSLRLAIRERQLAAGDRLPNEPDLARQLGVSRMTLREALGALERDGFLHRRPGVGTFINAQAHLQLDRGLDELFSTTDLIESHGYKAGAKHVEVRRESADAVVAAALQIDSGASVVHLERTRQAGNTPVIQCEEYLPLKLFEAAEVNPGTLRKVVSLYAFLEERLGVEIITAEVKVTACAADDRLAHLLRVQRGHALLLLEQIHFASNHGVVCLSRNYHNPELIRFRLTRRRSR